MAEKKVIELEVKTESLGSLKSQLRQAQAEVAELSAKFGATSQEAVNAAKKAAELKDAIGDAKALTDAYNPDAKFNALSQSLTGVLNGFQAFEGALGLVGVESEAVQEQLLKVQSAMALAQGVSGVLESIDSFKTLGTQIMNLSVVQKISTAAQWLWNAAMNANPLGAIVLAITAVIAAGYKLISFFQESAAENERTSKSIDKHSKQLDKQKQKLESSASSLESYNKYQYDMAKATGKSSEELRKIALKHAEEELALARKNKELAKATYLRELDRLATLRANDANDENIKKQIEVVNKAKETATKMREAAQEEKKELVDLKRAQRVEIAQEQTDANKEEIEKAKQLAKERADAAREANKQRRQAAKEEREKKEREEKEAADKEKQRQEDELKAAEENQKRIAKQKEEQRIQDIADEEAFYDQYNETLLTQQQKEEQAVTDKYFALIENAKKYGLDTAQLEEQQNQEVNAIRDKYRQDDLNKEKQAQQEKVDLAFKYAQEFGNVMSSLTNLLNANDQARLDNVKKGSKEEEAIKKRMFERDKKLRLVQTVIDTASNIVQSVRNGGGIPAGIPFGVAAAAMGAMQIAAIAKTKFQGSGGGGDESPSPQAPSGAGAGGGAITPSFNVVGNAQATNPLAGLGNQPIQAYVVSGEVTTAQSLDRNRVNYATFG